MGFFSVTVIAFNCHHTWLAHNVCFNGRIIRQICGANATMEPNRWAVVNQVRRETTCAPTWVCEKGKNEFALLFIISMLQKRSEIVLMWPLRRTQVAFRRCSSVEAIHTCCTTVMHVRPPKKMCFHWSFGRWSRWNSEFCWIFMKIELNANQTNCYFCTCSDQVCIPTRSFRILPGMSNWCQTNCLRYPPNCPESVCHCPWVYIYQFTRKINLISKRFHKLIAQRAMLSAIWKDVKVPMSIAWMLALNTIPIAQPTDVDVTRKMRIMRKLKTWRICKK